MDIAALLNPASVAPSVGVGVPNDPLKAGDAFAGVLAEAIGNGANTSVALPEAVGLNGPPTVDLPVEPAAPIVPTVPTSSPIPIVAEVSKPPISQAPQSESLVDTKATDWEIAIPEIPVSPNPVENSLPPISRGEPPVASPAVKPDTDVPEVVAKGDVPAESPVDDAPPAEEALPETPFVGKKPTRNPKSPPVARRIDAPPDPPHAGVAPDKGATTQAPTAPVEKPDPKSKDLPTAKEDSPLESIEDGMAIVPPVSVPSPHIPPVSATPVNIPPVTVPPISVPPVGVPRPTVPVVTAVPAVLPSNVPIPAPSAVPVAVDAMAVVAKASVNASQAAPLSPAVSQPPVATPEGIQANPDLTAPNPVKETNVDAAPKEVVVSVLPDQSPALSQPIAAVAATTAAEVSPSVAPAPVLTSAPDLGIVPQVVTVAVQATTTTISPATPVAQAAVVQAAAQVIPNAEVAKIAQSAPMKIVDRPAAKTDEIASTPSASSTASTSGLTDSSAMTGEGESSDDESNPDSPEVSIPASVGTPTSRTVATEKPEAGKDRSSIDRHLVVRQVADRIETLAASRPKDGVVIHLEPRDLGTITVVVKGLQSALDVQVMASDDRVRQSLDASRPELAQALVPRGIDLRELRVSTAPSNSNASTSAGTNPNGGNPNGGNPNPDGRSRPYPSSSFVKASRTESAVPRASRSRSNGRGVDLLA